MSDKPPEPKKVRLTEDYIKDLSLGFAYPAGTILERWPSGQYVRPDSCLGQGGAIAYFALIEDICEEIE